MKLSIRYADKIVGAMVILALVILIFAIFMLGSSQRWFARDYNFITYFPSAVGLNQNMPIQYKGFTIGRVKSIELVNKDGIDQVETKFIIFDTYVKWVKDDSYVEVVSSPLGALMGNQFLFHPGDGESLINEESKNIFLDDKKKRTFIPSMNSPEWLQMVADGKIQQPEHKDPIISIMNSVDELLVVLNDALKGNGAVDKMEETDTNLRQIIENVNDVVAGLKPLPNTLNTTIDGLSEQIDSVLENLSSFSGMFADPDGSVAAVLDSDGAVYHVLVNTLDSFSKIIKDLQKISNQLPVQLRSVLVDVDDVVTSVKNNPLLKGGVPERKETNTGGAYTRDMEF